MTAAEAGRIVDVLQAAYCKSWDRETIAVWIERLIAWREPFDTVMAAARRMIDSERWPSIAALKAALDLESAYRPRLPERRERLSLEDRRERLVNVRPLLRECIEKLEARAQEYRKARIGSSEAA
jgi:hypothetical protein